MTNELRREDKRLLVIYLVGSSLATIALGTLQVAILGGSTAAIALDPRLLLAIAAIPGVYLAAKRELFLFHVSRTTVLACRVLLAALALWTLFWVAWAFSSGPLENAVLAVFLLLSTYFVIHIAIGYRALLRLKPNRRFWFHYGLAADSGESDESGLTVIDLEGAPQRDEAISPPSPVELRQFRRGARFRQATQTSEDRETGEEKYPWLQAPVPAEVQELYQAAKARLARRRLLERIVRIGAGALLGGGMLWVTLWHIKEPRPIQTVLLVILFVFFVPQYIQVRLLFDKEDLKFEEWTARLDAAAEWEHIHGRPHKAEWKWW